MQLTPASALVRLMALMGEQGCTHEQRRAVADSLAEIRLSQGPVIPTHLITSERTVIAQTLLGMVEIPYPIQ